jgi:hypothetical protein
VRNAFQAFARKFGLPVHVPAHIAFFKEVNESHGKNWLVSLLKRTGSQVKTMRKKLGLSDVDEAAPPLMAHLFLKMCEALDEKNKPEAFTNKLLLVMQRALCARASDLKSVAWEDIRVHTSGEGVRYTLDDWMQKVLDRKPIPLLPGYDNPHLDVFAAMSDAAASGAFNVKCPSSTDTQHFLFPELHKGTTADAVLTSLLRSFVFEDADPTMSSHSVRHGTVFEATAGGFSPAAVAWFSGHAPDMAPAGILSYLIRTALAATPVAAFTAGWPGRSDVFTHSPEPPNLDALSSDKSYQQLNLVAEKLFNIGALTTPWLKVEKLDLQKPAVLGGTIAPKVTHLHRLVRTWLATQIMYFPRRLNRYGKHFLPVAKLVDAVGTVLKINDSAATVMITGWADSVHNKFVEDNQRCIIDASLLPTLRKFTEVAEEGQAAISQLATTVAAVAQQQVLLMKYQALSLQLLQRAEARAEADYAARAAGAGEGVLAFAEAAARTGAAVGAVDAHTLDVSSVMAKFTETAAIAASAAAQSASATAALRALGGIQQPRSKFPHDEQPRTSAVGGGGTQPLPVAVAPALPPKASTSVPAPGARAPVAQLSRAAPRADLEGFASTAAAAGEGCGGALTDEAPPPPLSLPLVPRPSVPPPPASTAAAKPPLPAAPSDPAPAESGGQAFVAGFLAGRQKVTVVLDTSKSLAETYFDLLRKGVTKRVAGTKTFDHKMTENEREQQLRESASQSPVSKQKWDKVRKALIAMDAMATSADRIALWAVWGTIRVSTDVSTLEDNARAVTEKLAALVKLRVDFTATETKVQLPAWKTSFTGNTFEERVLKLDDVVSKESWSKAPSAKFWGMIADCHPDYRAHAEQALAEMPRGGASAGGGGEGGAAAGRGGGGGAAPPQSPPRAAGGDASPLSAGSKRGTSGTDPRFSKRPLTDKERLAQMRQNVGLAAANAGAASRVVQPAAPPPGASPGDGVPAAAPPPGTSPGLWSSMTGAVKGALGLK